MEQLWKDYIAFEQNINPIIAEKMAIERSRDYMNARRVAKELEAVTRGLNRSAPSVPPTGHPEEIKQVQTVITGKKRITDDDLILAFRSSFGRSTSPGSEAIR